MLVSPRRTVRRLSPRLAFVILVRPVLVMFVILFLLILILMFLHTLRGLKRPVLVFPPTRLQIHVVDVVVVVGLLRGRHCVEMRLFQNRTFEPAACLLGRARLMVRRR